VSPEVLAQPAPSPRPKAPRARRRSRVTGGPQSRFAQGQPMVWLMGGGLVVCMAMVIGLLLLVFVQGLATFWPTRVHQVWLHDGSSVMGEITRTEEYRPGPEILAALPDERRAAVQEFLDRNGGSAERRLFRTGNYKLTNEHFRWVSDFEVAREEEPPWAVQLERLTWGRAVGTPLAFLVDGAVTAEGPERSLEAFDEVHGEVRARWREQRQLETTEMGEVHARLEEARLRLREIELSQGLDSPAYLQESRRVAEVEGEANREFGLLRERIEALDQENARYALRLEIPGGATTEVPLAEVVRLVPSNQLGFLGELGVYLSRWREFLLDDPREANSEGGVFPAIFGTVVMTLLMTLAVVPIGVLAALYLREYAKAGLIVSGVRIAINNLAGVPSIVFGVFGLGFFCYLVGGSIDQMFFGAKLPTPTFGTGGVLWAALTLALLTLPVVIVATEEALAAVPNSMREGSYGCGASKWQTIRRIVLPRAMPGITTGMILAMARGAGEVAPLMLVGAVKLAPELPIDGSFPFIHAERSFMHLGFHIYDLGFQSQNSEAAKPMVFTTTLLLITIVVALNLAAIALRARLHRRFKGSHI